MDRKDTNKVQLLLLFETSSDLKNEIFKMAFSKFKCSQNYFETSLFTWQSMCTII